MNISSKLANKGYRNDPHICRVIHTMNTEYSSIHALRNLFECHRHPFLLRTAAPTHKLWTVPGCTCCSGLRFAKPFFVGSCYHSAISPNTNVQIEQSRMKGAPLTISHPTVPPYLPIPYHILHSTLKESHPSKSALELFCSGQHRFGNL